MSYDYDVTRRLLITALAGLSITNLPHASATTSRAKTVQNNSPILVAYFSRSGNTRVIAGVIQRTLKANLFEILPATPYPEDYFQTVDQASGELNRGFKPALANNLANIAHFKTIYLGFPVWATRVPPVIQTFLSTNDLSGKRIIPFITHGGYGKGSSENILSRLAPKSIIEKPLVMECDQERRTTETVLKWLNSERS